MIEECHAVASLIESLPLDVVEGMRQQPLLDELRDLVQLRLPYLRLESRDVELVASKVLGQCRQCLVDLIDGWNVRSNLLYSILTAYIKVHIFNIDVSQRFTIRSDLFVLLYFAAKVCNDVAMVLEMLDFSTLDVARWYSLAVRLADVIASDELSLKLHDILKRFNCLVLTAFFYFHLLLSPLLSLCLYRSDLKSLLDSIGSAAFNLLKLDPHYQLL